MYKIGKGEIQGWANNDATLYVLERERPNGASFFRPKRNPIEYDDWIINWMMRVARVTRKRSFLYPFERFCARSK